MHRPLSLTKPGAFYHITSPGIEQKPVFKIKRDREKYLEYSESVSEGYGAGMTEKHKFWLFTRPSILNFELFLN